MFFSTFDLQKGQALPGPPKKGLRQVCHYPNKATDIGANVISRVPKGALKLEVLTAVESRPETL